MTGRRYNEVGSEGQGRAAYDKNDVALAKANTLARTEVQLSHANARGQWWLYTQRVGINVSDGNGTCKKAITPITRFIICEPGGHNCVLAVLPHLVMKNALLGASSCVV